jgi:hypothetical protein
LFVGLYRDWLRPHSRHRSRQLLAFATLATSLTKFCAPPVAGPAGRATLFARPATIRD